MTFPTEEHWIAQTEETMNVRFPTSYRCAMMEWNGGNVMTDDGQEWELHPFFDRSDRKRITRTSNSIDRETASARSWVGFPDNAVAIGHDGGGNSLILLPEGDTATLSESIYWWDHETGETLCIATTFDALERELPPEKPSRP